MESLKRPLSLAEVAGASLLVLLLFVFLANRDGVTETNTRTEKPAILSSIKSAYPELSASEWERSGSGWIIAASDPKVSIKLIDGRLELISFGYGLPQMISSIKRCSILGNISFSFSDEEKSEFNQVLMDFAQGKNPNHYELGDRLYTISGTDIPVGEMNVTKIGCTIAISSK